MGFSFLWVYLPTTIVDVNTTDTDYLGRVVDNTIVPIFRRNRNYLEKRKSSIGGRVAVIIEYHCYHEYELRYQKK